MAPISPALAANLDRWHMERLRVGNAWNRKNDEREPNGRMGFTETSSRSGMRFPSADWLKNRN